MVKTLIAGAKQDQLSKEVTEVFPGVNLASFLTLSGHSITKYGIVTVIEVSKELHDVPAVDTVTHIQMNGASTEDNFDKIADKVANTKKDGGNVLISCEESTGLAATLSIAYSIKYEGISVKNASKTVSKKRPKIYLD